MELRARYKVYVHEIELEWGRCEVVFPRMIHTLKLALAAVCAHLHSVLKFAALGGVWKEVLLGE